MIYFFLETHHQLVVEFHSTNTLINSKFQYPPGNPQAFDRRPCWGGGGGEGEGTGKPCVTVAVNLNRKCQVFPAIFN